MDVWVCAGGHEFPTVQDYDDSLYAETRARYEAYCRSAREKVEQAEAIGQDPEACEKTRASDPDG
jgi:hypothetical protein